MPSTGELIDIERVTISSEGDRWKSTFWGNSLAVYPTSRTVLRAEGGSNPASLTRRRRPQDPGIAVGLWGAMTGGVRQCGLGRISLSLRLARSQSQRYPAGGLLSDALCLVPGLAAPPHPTRILGALSPAIPTTSTPTAFPSTAIVALRAGSSRLAHLAPWHSRRNYPLR